MACYRKKGIGFAFCLKKAAEMPPFLWHLGRSKKKSFLQEKKLPAWWTLMDKGAAPV